MQQVNLEKLKKMREDAGLTQEDVAKLLGYRSALGYHYIESGRCRLRADQAVVLAKRYNVPVEALFLADNITNAVMSPDPQAS